MLNISAVPHAKAFCFLTSQKTSFAIISTFVTMLITKNAACNRASHEARFIWLGQWYFEKQSNTPGFYFIQQTPFHTNPRPSQANHCSLSNQAVLIKSESGFCYCNAYFQPQIFSVFFCFFSVYMWFEKVCDRTDQTARTCFVAMTTYVQSAPVGIKKWSGRSMPE